MDVHVRKNLLRLDWVGSAKYPLDSTIGWAHGIGGEFEEHVDYDYYASFVMRIE